MTSTLDAIVAAIDHQPGMSTAELHARAERSVARHLPLASTDERRSAVDAALDRLNGRGPIDRLLADPDVDEVIIHAGGELWVDRAGCLSPAGSIATSDTIRFLERALAPLGRRLDRTTPIVDARLDDGTRLCAAIAPVAVAGTEVSLRRHRVGTLQLHDFAPAPVCDVIATLLERRSNIVVTGATSSGKTSLLACLITDRLRAGERIVLLEDTAEISAYGHLVRLEARPRSTEGTAAIPLDELLVTALRLRPDRLVVGEIRGDEVITLVQAMNTGHDGSMATCHANGPTDAIHRLSQLVLRAAPGWPMPAIVDQLHRSIDAIVHLGRGTNGRRQILSISEPDGIDVRPLTDHERVIAAPQRSR